MHKAHRQEVFAPDMSEITQYYKIKSRYVVHGNIMPDPIIKKIIKCAEVKIDRPNRSIIT